MANSDKDILITPAKDTANLPEINFKGFSNDPIRLRVLDDNTISFEGAAGQLFSINNNLSSGSVFSVNDISGVPGIDFTAQGLTYLNPYYGTTILGPGSKTLTNIDSSDAPVIIGRTQNIARYDLEIRSNHGISDGNYGGITFKQQADGLVSLASIRLEYTNSGFPHLGFYTRSGNAEVRRMVISAGGGSGGRDGTVGFGVDPGTNFWECSATLNANTSYSYGSYNALMITSTNSSGVVPRGGAITCMAENASTLPWVGFGMWASGGVNNVYIGGGGWNLTEGTVIRFYTGATGNSNNSRGTERWVMDSSGHMVPSSNASYDIGSASYRVRNIYTADLHMSNKGSQNSVDGTWGDWTLQEGEDTIYMINNRNGKKYKMSLQEVN